MSTTKTRSRTTVRNASREQLLGYLMDIAKDYPDHLTTDQLRVRVARTEAKTTKWFGGLVPFSVWAEN